MKKISILFLSLVFLFTLAACSCSQGAVPNRNTGTQSAEPDSVKAASEQEKATSERKRIKGIKTRPNPRLFSILKQKRCA